MKSDATVKIFAAAVENADATDPNAIRDALALQSLLWIGLQFINEGSEGFCF